MVGGNREERPDGGDDWPEGDEKVEEADEESFPASDPPSTWSGAAG